MAPKPQQRPPPPEPITPKKTWLLNERRRRVGQWINHSINVLFYVCSQHGDLRQSWLVHTEKCSQQLLCCYQCKQLSYNHFWLCCQTANYFLFCLFKPFGFQEREKSNHRGLLIWLKWKIHSQQFSSQLLKLLALEINVWKMKTQPQATPFWPSLWWHGIARVALVCCLNIPNSNYRLMHVCTDCHSDRWPSQETLTANCHKCLM